MFRLLVISDRGGISVVFRLCEWMKLFLICKVLGVLVV